MIFIWSAESLFQYSTFKIFLKLNWPRTWLKIFLSICCSTVFFRTENKGGLCVCKVWGLWLTLWGCIFGEMEGWEWEREEVREGGVVGEKVRCKVSDSSSLLGDKHLNCVCGVMPKSHAFQATRHSFLLLSLFSIKFLEDCACRCSACRCKINPTVTLKPYLYSNCPVHSGCKVIQYRQHSWKYPKSSLILSSERI